MRLLPPLVFLWLSIPQPAAVCASREDSALIRPVNQTFVGDNQISVLPIVGFSKNFKGRDIDQLLMKAHSEGQAGLASAMVDGKEVTATQKIEAESRLYSFDLPRSWGQIGEQLEAFQIHLRGQIVVEAVGVKLVPLQPTPRPPVPPSPPLPLPTPGPVRQPVPPTPQPRPPIPAPMPEPRPKLRELKKRMRVHQFFHYNDTLELARYIDFRPYIGYRLRSITVHGISIIGTAVSTLCLHSHCSSKNISGPMDLYKWPVKQPVTRNNQGWRLHFKGELWIERIDFDFGS